MNNKTIFNNRNLIDRYLDQPSEIPAAIRKKIEQSWGGEPVQLYALADLDQALRLKSTWVALGPNALALASQGQDDASDLKIKVIPRDKIGEIAERPGMSLNAVTLYSAEGEETLAVLRYSLRQRQAMAPLLYVLKQKETALALEQETADTIYAESVVASIKKAQASVAKNKLAVVWRLLKYLKPYRWPFAAGILAAMMLTLVSLLPPYLTGYLIDEVLLPYANNVTTKAEAYRSGWYILGTIATMFVIREIFLFLRLRTMTKVGEQVARDLRRDVYDHLHKLSVNYFSSHPTGSIISRVGSDTDRIWDFIAFGVAEMTLSILMVLGLGGMLIFLDWRLGLIITLPIPLIFLGILHMGKKLHRAFLRIWQKWSVMMAVLSDTIPGMNVVKAFNQENYERSRFGRRNQEVTEEAFRINIIWTTYWPIIYFGLNAMTLLVWVFALPRLLGDGPSLTTGLFVTFLLYMGMFIAPIENFGFLTRMINRSLSSAHRVFEVLDTEPEVRESINSRKLKPVRGQIQFNNVSFGYDPVRHNLSGVSFKVEAGEMIGLVGPSGAGKTTIINLIARFYDIIDGQILVDGVDIQELDLGDYRKQIGMVMQDPYLFHGSILDNIRYGLQEASEDMVVGAAKTANAHDFICQLPHGYETIVGERGHTLSGGERQRVSIARAVLHNPRILILDEATSSVDTQTERKIQEALERLIKGRTVLAIAHRLSTLRKADRLFVMNEGKLVEQGTHEELLGRPDGIYKNLFQLQQELHEMYAV